MTRECNVKDCSAPCQLRKTFYELKTIVFFELLKHLKRIYGWKLLEVCLLYLYSSIAVSKILPTSINMIKLMEVKTHLHGKQLTIKIDGIVYN